MDLNLTEHVRKIIYLFYKQHLGWNSDIWNFFSEKKSILAYISLKINIFRSTMFFASLWRHTLTDFYDFGTSGKKRPYSIHFGRVNFKFTGGGNHPP